MDNVNCKLNIPYIQGMDKSQTDQQLTVGRRFILSCEGEWNKQFDFSKAQLTAEGLQPAMTKIFHAQAIDLNSFEIDTTFYAPMKIPSAALVLKDGVNEIGLSYTEFEIHSVLPKNQGGNTPEGAQQQPPKPYGFIIGTTELPQMYWILSIALTALLIALGLFSIIRRQNWLRMEARLRNYDSPQSPEGQAYRNLRQLEKSGFKVSSFKETVYLYILRRYQTPIFELKNGRSTRRLNSYLKSKWPRLKEHRRQIFHFVNDIDLLEKLPADQQIENSKKMINRFYNFVESSEDYFGKQREKDGL